MPWHQAIFNTVIDGIVIIDPSGKILHINPAACKLFGYTSEELLHSNITRLMPLKYAGNHQKYVDNYIETRIPKVINKGRELEGKRKDGTTFPFRIAINESKIDGQAVFVGIIHSLSEIYDANLKIKQLNKKLEKKVIDRTFELESVVNSLLQTNQRLKKEIHEREQVESKLRSSEKKLKLSLEKEIEINNLKSRFVAMASHEFKTPLATILSSASLIARYTETSQQGNRDKHITRIKKAVSYLNSVLTDFLSLSALEDGIIENQLEEVDVVTLAEEVAQDIANIKKEGQDVNITSHAPSPLFITDKRILTGILHNLLSNALKYSAADVQLNIKLDENLTIIVEDKGIGIPKAEQEHLFTKFFRAANVTGIPGSGLGLNIVRHYVDNLNGTITYQSAQGEGSTFKIILPKLDVMK